MNARAYWCLILAVAVVQAELASAQPPVVPPPGFGPKVEYQAPKPAAPVQQAPPPAAAKPAEAQKPAPSPLLAAPDTGSFAGLNLQGVALSEVVDFLARRLKINYIMDPRVRGSVSINTYGETKDIDTRALLDLILRINGAAMVQAGAVFRIVPLSELAKMPLTPEVDQNRIPEDDRAMLNLIFLKYANVEELSKLIDQFLGPEGKSWAYAPANLLLVLDSRRNMKRTMELVALFDSDTLAKQRVRLFDIKNSKPSDLAAELERLMKSMSLSKEMTSIKFIPVDRINTLIAIAPNPGAFVSVKEWIDKLDLKVTGASGKVDTYVYRVRFGRADFLAGAIMMLFSAYYPWMSYGGYGGMGFGGMGFGGMMGGGYGGAFGNAYGGGAYGGGAYGGYGGGYGGMMGGGYGGFPMASPFPGGMPTQTFSPAASAAAGIAAQNAAAAGGGTTDQTGSYLTGSATTASYATHPRVVPNPMDNSLLILATAEEYDSINRMLRELDIPPRQVLIEAKIYEVGLTGAFQFGVDYYLRTHGAGSPGPNPGTLKPLASLVAGAGSLTSGVLVGQSRELLAVLTAQESTGRTKVISSPSIIATDSVPASINVGQEVPTLSAQAVTGAISGGNSLFANTITNRSTGVTLGITARVNPSGVVTLVINQEVSAPQPPQVGAIQSPSFTQRRVQTQVTLQDGDTIAIGGIIAETAAETVAGVPWLARLPIAGYLFGSKSSNKSRSELVVFMTPRVIYDTNEMVEASDEIVTKFKRLQKLLRD